MTDSTLRKLVFDKIVTEMVRIGKEHSIFRIVPIEIQARPTLRVSTEDVCIMSRKTYAEIAQNNTEYHFPPSFYSGGFFSLTRMYLPSNKAAG